MKNIIFFAILWSNNAVSKFLFFIFELKVSILKISNCQFTGNFSRMKSKYIKNKIPKKSSLKIVYADFQIFPNF
jgi:hypothetical protein